MGKIITTSLGSGISPIGEFKFCHLNEPDRTYKPEGEFNVSLLLDPEKKDIKEWVSKMENLASGKELSWNRDKDTGWILVKFKTNKKPKIVDASTVPIPENIEIGWHSLGRISFGISSYGGKNPGCVFYINGVQVTKLVERTGGAFDKVVETPEDAGDDDKPF